MAETVLDSQSSKLSGVCPWDRAGVLLLPKASSASRRRFTSDVLDIDIFMGAVLPAGIVEGESESMGDCSADDSLYVDIEEDWPGCLELDSLSASVPFPASWLEFLWFSCCDC